MSRKRQAQEQDCGDTLGFKLPDGLRWNSPEAHRILKDHLYSRGITIAPNDQQPGPPSSWTAATRLALTCNYCGITNNTTNIKSLQSGHGMSCICSGYNSISQRWYYESAVEKLFVDKYGKPWYSKLHDGSIAKISWEVWQSSTTRGCNSTITLTCNQCGITNDLTTISTLQRGYGMSCMCCPNKTARTERWYYDAAIQKPFVDKKGKTWYKKLHDGTIEEVSWETWHSASQGKDATIPLTCKHCGITNNTTKISNLQQGWGMTCLCSGYNSLSQRWYYESAVQKPFVDKYGKTWYPKLHDGTIAEIPWEIWLSAALQGRGATIPLTCNHCGITNNTTSINSLQRGQGMCCMCRCGNDNISQRWYYNAAIQKPFIDKHGKTWYPKLHDGSITEISWETWQSAASRGCNSVIPLTCNYCGITNDTTVIYSLQTGHGMSCLCSGHNSLSQRWYYESAIQKPFVDKDGKVWYPKLHDGSIAKISWETWQSAALQGADTPIELTCNHCGITNNTTSISRLQQGQGMSCLCCGYNSLSQRWYYDTAIKKLFVDKHGKVWYPKLHDGSISEISWETWLSAASRGSNSVIPLTCNHCGITNSLTTISKLQSGHGMNCMCFCGNKARSQRWYYDSAIKRPFVDKQGRTLYPKLHDGTLAEISWNTWEFTSSQGFVPLTCNRCDITNDTTNLQNLRNGSGMSCYCRNKTQAVVARWLAAQFSQFIWESELRLCRNVTGKILPFDEGCHALKLLIEVDGDQHFYIDGFFLRTQADLDERVQLDLFKEEWAIKNGYLVLRVLQRDVAADRYDWRGFLYKHIQHRIDAQVAGFVLTGSVITKPDTPEYDSGIYYDIRHV